MTNSRMDTLDICSISSIENQDRIIEFNPYSSTIRIERIEKTGTFGYESESITEEFITQGIIRFISDRRFLKMVGINPEEGIPIIGIFKNQDKFKKYDKIIETTKDVVDGQIVDIVRKYEITDIKTKGDLRNARRYFLLSPIRGKNL